MKISNHIIILLLWISLAISAQTKDSTVNRKVTIEREFVPLIQDAGKLKSSPKILEPSLEKSAPKYSDFNLPLNTDFNIHILSAAELQLEKRKDNKGGFARVGLGNFYNTLADFAYPIIKSPKTRLDLSLHHLATFGTKKHSTTNAELSFDQFFDAFNFYGGLGGAHEYLKYYGNNYKLGAITNLDTLAKYNSTNPQPIFEEKNRMGINTTPRKIQLDSLANDSVGDTFWRFDAFIGVRSLPLNDGLKYQAQLKYQLFDSRNGMTENVIHTQGGFSTVGEEKNWGIDFDLKNLIYNSHHSNLLNTWNSYSVFKFNPYYSIERTNWNARLGAKSSFSIGHGKPINPSLDINGEWKLTPKSLAIYGGLTGNYEVNTLNDIFTENRYLSPDIKVDDTFTPFEFYAGIKIKPLYNLLLDTYIDYSSIQNQYFFVNKEYSCSTLSGADGTLYSNRFNVLYSNASLFKIGARASYNLRNIVNVELKGAYNGWKVNTETYAWNKPAWDASLKADMHFTHDLSFSVNTFLEGERYAKLGTAAVRMRPKVDINLGAAYSYNNWLTVFARLNNLINNPYQDFYGYQVQGINGMVGAAFSF